MGRGRGRPQIEIDKKAFESLCGLQCTCEEISAFFSCSVDTIERWCKREYKKKFAEVFAEKRSKGKISLRRMQWRIAEKNAAMAIFLGKQYLGQSDDPSKQEQAKSTEERLSDVLDAIAEAVKE